MPSKISPAPVEARGYIDPDNGQYVGPHTHIPSPRQPNPPSEDEDFSGCAIFKNNPDVHKYLAEDITR